jgi:hypothetical protein
MATALYATMLVQPGNVPAIQRYLYSTTDVVEVAPIMEYAPSGEREVGRLVFLILRTEERNEEEARSSQQYQCDRLASGMYGMTIGFQTRRFAQEFARLRATENDWGLVEFGPFALSAVDA